MDANELTSSGISSENWFKSRTKLNYELMPNEVWMKIENSFKLQDILKALHALLQNDSFGLFTEFCENLRISERLK